MTLHIGDLGWNKNNFFSATHVICL